MKVPVFRNSGEGTFTMTQKEEIGRLFVEDNSNGFKIAKVLTRNGHVLDCNFALNAGSAVLFPWCHQIAQQFESYKIKRIVFHSESLINSRSNNVGSMVGEIGMTGHDNPFVGSPATMQDIRVQAMSRVNRADMSFTCGFERSNRLSSQQIMYTRIINELGANDSPWWDNNKANETDIGRFFVGVENMGDYGPVNSVNKYFARLWVSYQIEFSRPVFSNHLKTQTTKEADVQQPSFPTTGHEVIEEAPPAAAQRSATTQSVPGDEVPTHSSNPYKDDTGKYLTHTNPNHLSHGIVDTFDTTKEDVHDTVIRRHGRWGTLKKGCTYYAKFMTTDYLGSTGNVATELAADKPVFKGGSWLPAPTASRSTYAYRALDNIGITCAVKSNNNTILTFNKLPHKDTIIKVTLRWNGLVSLNSTSENHAGRSYRTVVGNYNVCVIKGVMNSYILGQNGFRFIDSNRYVQEFSGTDPSYNGAYAPNDLNDKIWNTTNLANMGTGGFHLIRSDFYMEKYLRFTDPGTNEKPYIEITPFATYEATLLDQSGAVAAAGAPVGPWGNTQYPSFFSNVPVEWGARSIEVEEVGINHVPMTTAWSEVGDFLTMTTTEAAEFKETLTGDYVEKPVQVK